MAAPVTRQWGKVRKLPSGRWQASYIGPDKQRHTAETTYSVKLAAFGWLAEERRLIERRDWTPPATRESTAAPTSKPQTTPEVMTFGGWFGTWIKQHRNSKTGKPLAAGTRRDYESVYRLHIAPTFADEPIAAITATAVERWHAATLTDKPTQRAAAYNVLSLALKSAASAGVIAANPAAIPGASKSRREREPMYLSAQERAAIAANMPAGYAALVTIEESCGVRFSESTALRRCDVDTRAGKLFIRAATERAPDGGRRRRESTKSTAGQRVISIPPRALPLIEAHLIKHVGSEPDSLLFPAVGDVGRPLSWTTYRRWWVKATESAGVPGARGHDLRHSHLTDYARLPGVTIADVMERAGHNSPVASLRYLKANRQDEFAKLV